MAWWRDGVLYQIYPRSFADSNGDGIGDIRGIVDRLDHLAWLGVDGIWLNPVMPSPNADWGYDVADYCAVHPDLGTLDDLDLLLAEAGSRGIKVILDLVPNHSSDQHPWFVDSRSSRSARHRDWYVWADPKPDGSPPNNWRSFFGGGAWTFDEPTGQSYLHQFASEQPDLNWWNDEVRSAFDDIHRFWLDRGVAGWRIDVCHLIVKDRELRDNPTRVGPNGREIQDLVYQTDRPEVHDVIRRWREVADSYDPPRMLFGETYVLDVERIAAYYGTGDELHLALNVPFIHSPFEAERLRAVVERTEEVLPEVAWPIWTGSNHDARRLMTRWCRDDPARARLALVMLLTLRGTPLLYYGDEIGMPDNDRIPPEAVKDTATRRRPRGRDPGRTPMQWRAGPGAGFTGAGVAPWLPIGDADVCNVEDQRNDPLSMLHLCRDLIAFRESTPDLVSGAYRSLDAPAGCWVYTRGQGVGVALNMIGETVNIACPSGEIAICTDRKRDGDHIADTIELAPYEAAVVALDPMA